MAAVAVIVIIVAIVITIANILEKAKSYSSIQDAFAKAWASAFGTPVPEQALSAFTKMVSFITKKEVDRSFGGTVADDHFPPSDSLDDFRHAVNYDNNKVAVPIAIPVREPRGILRANSDFCTSAPPFSAGEKDGALCLPATI